MQHLLFSLFSLILFGQFAQAQSCYGVHDYCTESIPKEEQTKDWMFDSQSKSATVKRDTIYEMSFIAYKGFIYRLATCTDIAQSNGVSFELLHEVLKPKMIGGERRLSRVKETLYSNESDGLKAYYKFYLEKTEKLFVRVKVPSGQSENKAFKDTNLACVGVLLQKNVRLI